MQGRLVSMKAREILFVMLFRRDSALQGRFHFFSEESQPCRAGPGEDKVAELEKNLVKRTVGIFDFMKT